MGPLLLYSHTKGRRAEQPRGPGGKQWDFSSTQPQLGGQVQTASPPCEATQQLKRRGCLELVCCTTKEARDLLSAALCCCCLTERAEPRHSFPTGSGLSLFLGEFVHIIVQGFSTLTLSDTHIIITTWPNVFHDKFPLKAVNPLTGYAFGFNQICADNSWDMWSMAMSLRSIGKSQRAKKGNTGHKITVCHPDVFFLQ